MFNIQLSIDSVLNVLIFFNDQSNKISLDEDTLKRLQIVADDAMRQSTNSRQSRLEACLLRLRRELNDRVRYVSLSLDIDSPSPSIKN